jgi:hypothetical protein
MKTEVLQKIQEMFKPNTIMKYTGDPEYVGYYIILDLKKTLVRKLSGKYEAFEISVKCISSDEESHDMIGRIYRYDIDQWDLEYWSVAND